MICIDAENLRDGLYNIKDGKIYKYKAKGGTVRTYELRNIVTCGECKYFWKHGDLPTKCVFHLSLVNADDFCSYGVNCSEKPNNSKVSEKPTGSDRNYVDVRGAK